MAFGKIPPVEGSGKKQRRPFKQTRANIVLTREEVKAIKLGRKKLRKELRAVGIKSRKEFELTASGMMLYFDKPRFLAVLPWLFRGKGLWLLLGATTLLLLTLVAMSMVTELRGHFTINLSDGMFKEGFSMSETVDFENPTMRLFAEPAQDILPVSITDIKEDVNSIDGLHTADKQYFAYTFYLRNEGESTVDYTWQLRFNSETQVLADAVWVMVFEDDEMRFFAKPREDETEEALPYFDDETRGYKKCPFEEYAAEPYEQFELMAETEISSYYRLVPIAFESEEVITSGIQTEVAPMDVHKYTVVIWLEGDDPDCTNDKIGGYAGVDMKFQLEGEEAEYSGSFERKWEEFWDDVSFWD